MEILIALLVFMAVSLLLWSLLRQKPDPFAERLDSLRGMSIAQQLEEMENDKQLAESFRTRLLRPAFSASKGSASALLPASVTSGIAEKMAKAHVSMSVSAFITMVLALTIGMPALFLFAFLATGAPLGPMPLLAIVAMGLLGALLPRTWLNGRIRTRAATIEKALPDAIDLVTTCVEAGLGLDMALQRVTTKTVGPLAEELGIVLHEISMGRQRREALEDLAKRVGLRDLTQFVNSVIQAEQLGVSLGQVLRVQAGHLRMKRRQRAEEAAFKAPIKMLFPLVGFIFPSLFLVVLGPAGIALFNSMSKTAGG